MSDDTEGEECLVINEEEEDDDSLGSVQDLVNTATNTTGPVIGSSGHKQHTVSAPLSANTKRNMQWGVRVWEKWGRAWNKKLGKGHKRIPITRGDFVLVNEEELGKACSLFVQNVLKSDGSAYPPHSLYNLLFALSRFIKFNLGRPIDILDFRNKAFEPIADAMEEITKRYSETEISNEQKADTITWAHVKVLWDKGVLNYHSAKGLSRAAFIYNSKVFGIRSGRDHRMLLLEYFECGIDEKKGRYIEFQKGKFHRAKKDANGVAGSRVYTRPRMANTAALSNAKHLKMGEGVRIREYEVVGNTRSAYAVHKSYLETVHQYARYGPFYIKPQPTEVGTRVRFTSAAVGHNSLGTYVKDMMLDAGISGYFTNLSAGKHELNQIPDWVKSPQTVEQDEQIGTIQIVPNSAGSQVGPTSYIQCLNKNIPIAPKPIPTTSRASSNAVVSSATQATAAFTIANQNPTQTLVLVPVSQTTDRITSGLIARPVNTVHNTNTTYPAATTSRPIATTRAIASEIGPVEIINSVTVKEENLVGSEEETMDVDIKQEDSEHPENTRQNYMGEFFPSYPGAGGAREEGCQDPDTSRKRPLEIEPIDEADSNNVTTLLVKKLKALEERLQKIEREDKAPSPEAPDSSSGEKSRQSRPASGSSEQLVLEQLDKMEARITKLERSRSSVARVDAERLGDLEKTVDNTQATVRATHSKLIQTDEKLDRILQLILSKHSKR